MQVFRRDHACNLLKHQLPQVLVLLLCEVCQGYKVVSLAVIQNNDVVEVEVIIVLPVNKMAYCWIYSRRFIRGTCLPVYPVFCNAL
jgi:hypothetical protein